MSQVEFAGLIGCAAPTVHAIENGRLRISTALEARIFVETGADAKELIKGRKGNPLLSFHFQRSTWRTLDIAAGVILLISLAFHRISRNDA